ncbi:maleylpyruvate isomerase family mycothiol-dependent enzyme [Catenuloplanes niger JCM 9533]
MIAAERRGIADLIDSLDAGQLRAPSLCASWTVQQVAGHLVAAVSDLDAATLLLLVRSGFRVHRANDRLAVRVARRPAGELADLLRKNADNPFRPPVVGYPGQLTDLHVHGQDMRRPLGLPHALRPDALRVSLDFLVGGRAVGFTPKRRPAGLRFEATDLGWSWGAGPLVRGTGEAVLLALTGRTVVLPELDGDGVPHLTRRLHA